MDNPFADALEWYETHEWVKNRTYLMKSAGTADYVAGACLSGVLGVVTGTAMAQSHVIDGHITTAFQERMKAHSFLDLLIRESTGAYSVANYNDAYCQSYDDARVMLEKARAKWDETDVLGNS